MSELILKIHSPDFGCEICEENNGIRRCSVCDLLLCKECSNDPVYFIKADRSCSSCSSGLNKPRKKKKIIHHDLIVNFDFCD